jgi:hypothetical protein
MFRIHLSGLDGGLANSQSIQVLFVVLPNHCIALSHASSIFANGSGSASLWSDPISINADDDNPLFRTSSSESSNGITSSARECRMIVFDFTVVTVP